MIQTVFVFEWKKLISNYFFLTSILLLLLASIYSLYNGKQMIEQQKNHITQAQEKEKSVFNEVVKQIKYPDTSTAEAKWRYPRLTDASWTITSPNKRWTTHWQFSPVAALSVGNRDVYPYYHEVEPYSFYMRFFKNEISSPIKLLYGNFDLAFVIILLFPLFIIALTFDLYAVEKENGTYPILHSITNAMRVINFKLLFYLLVTLGLLNLVMLISLAFISPGTHQAWFNFTATANIYLVIWFCIVFLFQLLKRSAVVNAILLISSWIFLCIALPAIANSVANSKYQVNPEVFSKYIRRVQMSNDPQVKKKMLEKFYSFYPQYKNTDTTGNSYQSKLYIAYGNLNDREADPLLENYINQLQQKENFLIKCNFLNPAIWCQQNLNGIAATDLKSYITYVRNVRAYVQNLKETLTEKSFNEIPLTIDELQNRLTFEQFIKQNKTSAHVKSN